VLNIQRKFPPHKPSHPRWVIGVKSILAQALEFGPWKMSAACCPTTCFLSEITPAMPEPRGQADELPTNFT
jgi:hypothetical protein